MTDQERLQADLAAAELMVRRLADQAVRDEARIAAVEATVRSVIAHAEWVTEDLDHRKLFPTVDVIQPLRAVLAASPTPTGPEPAKRPCCARPGWCACDPLTPGDEHCQWFGPATPTEPTEETK